MDIVVKADWFLGLSLPSLAGCSLDWTIYIAHTLVNSPGKAFCWQLSFVVHICGFDFLSRQIRDEAMHICFQVLLRVQGYWSGCL